MIERKIIITSCGECPFCEWKNPEYVNAYYACKKIERVIKGRETIHPECDLKVNIPSKNFRENV